MKKIELPKSTEDCLKRQIKPKVDECINRLENYNTLFDIETLFFILHDQMLKCHEQLLQGYNDDAKNTLNKMFSMFWVIKDKLPNSLFEDIEHVTHYLKYQNTSGHTH